MRLIHFQIIHLQSFLYNLIATASILLNVNSFIFIINLIHFPFIIKY